MRYVAGGRSRTCVAERVVAVPEGTEDGDLKYVTYLLAPAGFPGSPSRRAAPPSSGEFA